MSFSWRDHLVKLAAVLGPNRSDLRLLSGSKITIDPGSGAEHMEGFGELPFAIVRKSNKPKFSLDGMAADEIGLAREHVGGIGGYPFTITIVVTRPGITSVTWKIVRGEIGEGAGWNADEKGALDKFGGPCMDLLYARGNAKPVSIYAKRNPR